MLLQDPVPQKCWLPPDEATCVLWESTAKESHKRKKSSTECPEQNSHPIEDNRLLLLNSVGLFL